MIQEIMCKCSFNAYQTNSPENSLLNIGGNKDLLFVCLLSKISLNCSHEITIDERGSLLRAQDEYFASGTTMKV